MKLQYDLPQELFDAMLGCWDNLYPNIPLDYGEMEQRTTASHSSR